MRIIPYLIAMLCAVGAFTTSGAMEYLTNGISAFFSLFLSVWFITPGSEILAPVASIFLLELFITDSSGLDRILRPLIATFIFSFSVSLIYYFFRSKN